MEKINKVCVIGAGVMGSGIAAQVANSRTEVILLDIAGPDSKNPNSIVQAALDKLYIQKPSPLSHPGLVQYIKIGNLRDDLDLIRDSDLIIEVIVERLDIKHRLYENILPYLKKTAIISSNTSTLPLAALKQKLPPDIGSGFLITHFFNPPRFMELVEMVADDSTPMALVKTVEEFITRRLGKSVVFCNDTPGFIANRVGCFLLELAVRRGLEMKLDLAKIDQIFTKFFGFPSTGIFGLYDLIGHDVMGLISDSLTASLPKEDKYHQIYRQNLLLGKMRESGMLGRKSGSGFYRLSKQGDVKVMEVLDPVTFTYQTLEKYSMPETISELLEGEYGDYFSEVLRIFFEYVLSLIPVVTKDPADLDMAMKLGYSLKFGPFELLEDKMPGGVKWLERFGTKVVLPKSSKGKKRSLSYDEIRSNDSAKLLSTGKELVFVASSKMSALNRDVFTLMIESCKVAEDLRQNLYIYPSGPYFSAGADLKYFKEIIEAGNFAAIESYLDLGQKAMMTVKHSNCRVISCARGLALGGGCELMLHSSLVIAHQNIGAGLVELGVGLIPGWGGVKEMFLRSGGDYEKLIPLLRNILEQHKVPSADYLNKDYAMDCHIGMHKDYLPEDAIEITDGLKEFSRPKLLVEVEFKGEIDLASKIDTGHYDRLQIEVLQFFQNIVDRKKLTERELLEFEREKFLHLISQPLCLQRLSKFV
jgi:3-hydroxyacyl-CoA dehydrogenase/enoyl-CoA hydratase/3-hydroxybutyryl-CoA epimerase